MEAIWQAVKEVTKNQLPEATFDLWIEPLQAESGPRGDLVLSCPNPFALRWVQAHYLKLIQQILTTLNCTLPVHLKLLTAPVRLPVPLAGGPAFPAPGFGKARRAGGLTGPSPLTSSWWGPPTAWLTRHPRP